jgi:protein AaeX
MRFNEINLFGLYVAPIVMILAVAWIVYLLVRRVSDRFGLTSLVWHPALFELALYVIIVSSIVLMIARWSD